MATIVLRANTPAGLTNAQLDANFTNLNNDKVETSYLANTFPGTTNITTLGNISAGTWNGSTIAVARGGTGTTTSTGSGSVVLSNSPSLVTPTLGVATATSINKVTITAPATGSTLTIADGKTLTASNTLTLTGTDDSSIAFGAGGTVAYTSNNLGAFGATTSAQLASIITDETGGGKLVFATSPTFTTSIATDSATFSVANTTATTVSAFGAATAITIGATTGTTNIKHSLDVDGNVNVDGGSITTGATSFNIINTTATAVNAFGAATAIEIGAATGTTNINHNLDVDGDINIDGGDLTVSGTTFNLANNNATTVNAFGDAKTISIGSATAPLGTTTVNHNLVVTGDLTVNGSTVTVNTTEISVDDINIELGKVATPTDTTANGGGIILKGATDKTILWDSTNSNWTSSENLNIATGKSFKINNTSVLSSTTLGSTVTSSSLNKLGLTTAGFVKTDSSGNLSVDSNVYLTSQSNDFGTFAIAADSSGYTWGTANTNTSQVADSVGDTLTLVRGLTGSTAGIDLFTNTVAGTDAIKIAHADTSSLSGQQGAAGVSSITVDEMGHVTAVGTATYLTTATGFFWANQSVQSSSSTTTTPTFGGITLDNTADRTIAVAVAANDTAGKNLTIDAGDAGASATTARTGGTLSLFSGNGSGSATAGGTGGQISILSGAGTAGTTTTGVSGAILIRSNDAPSSGIAGATGSISIYSGVAAYNASETKANSGNILVYSGSSYYGNTGSVTITSGNALIGNSGNVQIYAGESNSATASGAISITGGAAVATSNGIGGNVVIKGGSSSSGTSNATGGTVYITGGTTSSTAAIGKTTGSVIIDGGGSGANGSIVYGQIYIGSNTNGTTYGTSAINIGKSGTALKIIGTGGAAAGFFKSDASGNVSIDTNTYLTTATGFYWANQSVQSASSTTTTPTFATVTLDNGADRTISVATAVNDGAGRALSISAGNAGASATAVRTGGALNIAGGAGTGTAALGGAGGAISITSGAGSNGTTTGGASGAVTIRSGNAGTGGNANAGTVTIDTGTKTGTGVAEINIGTTNATAIEIGRTGVTTTVNGTLSASLSGNASTATTLQNARTINGVSFNGSANIAVPSLYDTNYRRITNPGGGESVGTVSSATGAIAVTLPVGMTNTMMRMTIKVYEYATNESFEIHCGGYSYSTDTTWTNNPFAYIVGNPSVDRRFAVRFGYDSTAAKAVVYIGELNSVWSYPQIFITEVQLGFGGQSVTWTSGWTIGFESTAFKNVTATIENAQVGYATSSNASNAVVLRDSSGNFSAGSITAALSGNASTASKLQTAVNINGTSFDGSAAITTSSWGTSRNITIGSTTKAVDGSAAVSWSLADIGAAASDHSHTSLGNLATVGTITTGIWQATDVGLAHGGTGASLTAADGGIVYSTSSALAIADITGVVYANATGAPTSASASDIGAIVDSRYAQIGTTTPSSNYLYLVRSDANPTLYVRQGSTGDIARFYQSATAGATSGTSQVTITNTGGITATGVVATSAGSATAPSLTFSGDTNTGFYNTTDKVYVTAGGANAAYFGATEQFNYGNIYISTADDAAADATTTFRDSGALYFRTKYWNGSASANVDWNIIGDATAAGATANQLLFRVGTATKMTLSNAGALTVVDNITAYSDIRHKTDITRIENALEKVQALNGYTYNRIETGARQTGVIAQEVQQVLPEAVVAADNDEKTLSVAYGNMVGLLIEAIKEQQKQIDDLKAQVSQLKSSV